MSICGVTASSLTKLHTCTRKCYSKCASKRQPVSLVLQRRPEVCGANKPYTKPIWDGGACELAIGGCRCERRFAGVPVWVEISKPSLS